jgi:diacylglycerol kinase family enzyme
MATKNTFTRIIVLCNPVSTNASKTPQRIKELQRICPEATMTIIDTVPDGRSANVTLLAEHVSVLGPNTLLCIAAGDGTVNIVVEALLTDGRFTAAARQTTILPLWCGNANDLACMLNGLFHRTNLKHVLNEGVVMPIWPLQCQQKDVRGRVYTRLAVCYASFGASAFTAHWLGDTSRRARLLHIIPGVRFIGELLLVRQGLTQAPEFTIEENKKKTTVFERVFLNGSRFAKVAGTPLRLHEKHFYMATVERKTLASLIQRILQLADHRRTKQFLVKQVAFKICTQTWAQFDGDPSQVAANTHITMKLADNPIYVLSTKLQKSA